MDLPMESRKDARGFKMQMLTIFTRSIISFLLLSAVLVTVSQAAPRNSAADYLVQIAQQDYKNGKTKLALHELEKALILEPGHKDALKYVAEYSGKSDYQSIHFSPTVHMARMQSTIKAYESELEKLSLEKDIVERRVSDLRSREHTGPSFSTSGSELARGHYQAGAMDVISQIELDGREWDGDMYQKVVHAPVNSQDRVEEYLEYDETLHGDREEFLAFREKAGNVYAHQDKQIHVMEDYLSIREEQVEDYRDEFVTNEIDLAWQQRVLLSQQDELTELTESHDHLITHLDDTAFLVREEDRYMDALRGRLDQTRSQNSILKEELMSAHQKTDGLLEDRQELIRSLKGDLERMRKTP